MVEGTVKVFSNVLCPQSRQLKRFLWNQRVAYTDVDIDVDLEGRKRLRELQDGGIIVPTLLFPDGSFLVNPTQKQVAKKLGIPLEAGTAF